MRQIELVKLSPLAIVPDYQSEGAAGIDLHALLPRPIKLWQGRAEIIGTGVAIHIADPTLAGIIIPRSGAGMKQGLVVSNLVGLIDSDYQGEIKVGVWNRHNPGSGEPITIEPNDRIAQLVFVPVERVRWSVVEAFGQASKRGRKGLGSTGAKAEGRQVAAEA